MSEETKLYLIAPTGRLIDKIYVEAMESAYIDEVNAQGEVSDNHTSDFPDMEDVGRGAQHVRDATMDNDFLGHHCRLVIGPSDLSDYSYDEVYLEPWPDEIIAACLRAEQLEWCLAEFDSFQRSLPSSYRDSTVTTVLDKVVKGRLEDELEACEEKIRLFRKDRVEPTVITGALGEEEEEPEDADT